MRKYRSGSSRSISAPDITALERNMAANELTSGDFTESNEPFSLFGTWLKDAEGSEIAVAPPLRALFTTETGEKPRLMPVCGGRYTLAAVAFRPVAANSLPALGAFVSRAGFA